MAPATVTPEVTPISTAPAPEATATPTPVTVAPNPSETPAAGGQKVVQPINDLTKDGTVVLHKLAAAEEAKNPSTGTVVAPTTTSAVDPNSLAL